MPKPPKTRCSGTWTEARYWGFIRSALRRAFTRYPVNYHVRNAAKRPYKGPNKLQKNEFQCGVCKEWFIQKSTQVHHLVECGSLKSYADLPGFVERLFCEANNLQVVCKTCHNNITHKEDAKPKRERRPKASRVDGKARQCH
jgi:5-methylcytosine-specific restriction endonuclease McrA